MALKCYRAFCSYQSLSREVLTPVLSRSYSNQKLRFLRRMRLMPPESGLLHSTKKQARLVAVLLLVALLASRLLPTFMSARSAKQVPLSLPWKAMRMAVYGASHQTPSWIAQLSRTLTMVCCTSTCIQRRMRRVSSEHNWTTARWSCRQRSR